MSLTKTIETIRESWSISTMNEGLDINFVKQCSESCNSCSSHRTKCKMQVWHEKHVCHIDEVEFKLDNICKVHIVVRATRTKAVVGSNQVTYFKCHKDGNKRKKNSFKKKDAQCFTSARKKKSLDCVDVNFSSKS